MNYRELTSGQIMKMVAENTFREMNESDWMGLAGAEPGSFIAETKDEVIILLAPDGTVSLLGIEDFDGPEPKDWQVDLKAGKFDVEVILG